MGQVKTSSVRFTGVTPQFAVQDVVRTAEYYRDVLGFEIAGYWDGERVSLSPEPPPVFGIVRRGEVQVFFNRADSTGNHAFFDVTGVDALAADLRSRGADIIDGPENRVYGQREVLIRDCNGRILTFGEGTGGTGATG